MKMDLLWCRESNIKKEEMKQVIPGINWKMISWKGEDRPVVTLKKWLLHYIIAIWLFESIHNY